MEKEEFIKKLKSGELTDEELFVFLDSIGIDLPRLRGAYFLDEIKDFETLLGHSIAEEISTYADYQASFYDHFWNKPKTFADMHGKKRKHIKLLSKQYRKRLENFADKVDKYFGKPILCLYARQGGDNRKLYPIDSTHPRYLFDIDAYFDNTYCYIFYDFSK